MRRFKLVVMACALALFLPALARAQFPGPQGPAMFASSCANSPRMGGASACYDTTLHVWYYWSGTAFTVIPELFTISWDGALGGMTSSAVAPAILPAPAAAGHFTELTCTATLTGSCTGGPSISVEDITASTTGTAVSPTTTVGTLASHSETLTFAAGDTIALYISSAGSTCTAPTYHCTATVSIP